jgi:hypothetical protein
MASIGECCSNSRHTLGVFFNTTLSHWKLFHGGERGCKACLSSIHTSRKAAQKTYRWVKYICLVKFSLALAGDVS